LSENAAKSGLNGTIIRHKSLVHPRLNRRFLPRLNRVTLLIAPIQLQRRFSVELTKLNEKLMNSRVFFRADHERLISIARGCRSRRNRLRIVGLRLI
jgi:hypothetical protein